MTLQQSINQTLKYARFFDYDLTLLELHFWLISPQVVPLSRFKKSLPDSLLTTNYQLLTTRRLRRQRLARQKINSLNPFLVLLRFFPNIRLVALTGSLAMENAQSDDDLDLMIITSPHTLWLTRLLLVPLTRLFFKSRVPQTTNYELLTTNSLCLNLWLDELALRVPLKKQNLYTAHEVLQVKSLINRGQAYEKFILQNSWVKEYLANAHCLTLASFENLKTENSLKTENWLLKILNLFAFKLQYFYMKSKLTKEHITLHSAYFHPRDLSGKIISKLNPQS